MKNKGFTLIELLAVIVILAIIALIATPVILNIIEDARKSSAEQSVNMYGKAVENAIAKKFLNDSTYVITPGVYDVSADKKTLTDGTNTITVDYDGEISGVNKVKINKDGTAFFQVGDIVYGTPSCSFAENGDIAVLEGSSYVNTIGTIGIGDKITCGTESFYVISTDDATNVVEMLAEYNLNVGNNTVEGVVGIQNENAKGWEKATGNRTATVSLQKAENEIVLYKLELEKIKVNVLAGSLLTEAQYNFIAEKLSKPTWLTTGTYWTSTVIDSSTQTYRVISDNTGPDIKTSNISNLVGVRPVIKINKAEIKI